jgi:hypothetical protein
MGTKSDEDQNGFSCHLIMVTESILFTIQWWQLNPFQLPSNGAERIQQGQVNSIAT